MVVLEGMLATAMYFLIQGKCDVIGGYGTKMQETFGELTDGDHFGEIGVLMQVRPVLLLVLVSVLAPPLTFSFLFPFSLLSSQVKRTASVRAKTFCNVYVLTAMKLKLIAVRYPHVAFRIKQVVKTTMQRVVAKVLKMTADRYNSLTSAALWERSKDKNQNADSAGSGKSGAAGVNQTAAAAKGVEGGPNVGMGGRDNDEVVRMTHGLGYGDNEALGLRNKSPTNAISAVGTGDGDPNLRDRTSSRRTKPGLGDGKQVGGAVGVSPAPVSPRGLNSSSDALSDEWGAEMAAVLQEQENADTDQKSSGREGSNSGSGSGDETRPRSYTEEIKALTQADASLKVGVASPAVGGRSARHVFNSSATNEGRRASLERLHDFGDVIESPKKEKSEKVAHFSE
jgi:CRP-like cAMP-binding protein